MWVYFCVSVETDTAANLCCWRRRCVVSELSWEINISLLLRPKSLRGTPHCAPWVLRDTCPSDRVCFHSGRLADPWAVLATLRSALSMSGECPVYTFTRAKPHAVIAGCVLSCLAVSNSLQSFRLWPARLLCPWDFPGKNNGVGCHFLFQGIFLT